MPNETPLPPGPAPTSGALRCSEGGLGRGGGRGGWAKNAASHFVMLTSRIRGITLQREGVRIRGGLPSAQRTPPTHTPFTDPLGVFKGKRALARAPSVPPALSISATGRTPRKSRRKASPRSVCLPTIDGRLDESMGVQGLNPSAPPPPPSLGTQRHGHRLEQSFAK